MLAVSSVDMVSMVIITLRDLCELMASPNSWERYPEALSSPRQSSEMFSILSFWLILLYSVITGFDFRPWPVYNLTQVFLIFTIECSAEKTASNLFTNVWSDTRVILGSISYVALTFWITSSTIWYIVEHEDTVWILA